MDIATLLLEYLKELNAKSQKSQRKYLLNKGKKRFINNQKEEQYTEYSVIEKYTLKQSSKIFKTTTDGGKTWSKTNFGY